MPSTAAAPLTWFKALLFGLLAWNTAAYSLTGTLSEALDSAAWFSLLVLFLLETSLGGRLPAWSAAAIRTVRIAAAIALVAATIGYLRDEEWLDAINSALWVAFVVVLEIQVRYPAAATRHRARFSAAVGLICAGLGALVLAWAWQGEWFDAYDALLWLVALAVVEMDVMSSLPRAAHPAR